MIYNYVKEISNPQILLNMFMLKREIWQNTVTTINVHADENQMNNQVEVVTPRVLTSDELDAIAEIINDYNDGHELVIREMILENALQGRQNLGLKMILEFGAMNVFKNKDIVTLNESLEDLEPLMHRLVSGAFELAFIWLYKFVPNASLTQIEKDEFLRRLELQIGNNEADQLRAGVDAGVL